jgi:hypothetical protein
MELPDEVRALFEAPNYAHLATVLPDGGPLRTDRVVFLVEADHAHANAFG